MTDTADLSHLGLALSGGAAWGLAHIGVVEILEENKVPVKYIAGTSAGAIVGALLAGGMTARDLHDAAVQVAWRTLSHFTVPKLGFLSSAGIAEFIERNIGSKTFAQLSKALAVVTVDLDTGEEVILAEGPVAEAARASASIPVLFAPVWHEDRFLVDGGLVNNLPVDIVQDLGATKVIAVDVSSPRVIGHRPHTPFEVGIRALGIMQWSQVQKRASDADVLIRPDLTGRSPAALAQAEAVVQSGREAALQALPDILALLNA